MEAPALLMFQTLISLSLFSFVANQYCNEGAYVVINEPRRSTQSVYNDAVENPLCDAGIDEGTWFRFQSYSGAAVVERDANDPVPSGLCGTEIPIYIRGLDSHPVTDYGRTTATVCGNYGGSNTCAWTETIQIYRCPSDENPRPFYLYKLKSPPGCSIAYCAGEEIVCDQGDYWTGQECVDFLPAMTGFPIFSGPHINGNGFGKEIYFSCEVQYDRQQNDSNTRFRVTFLFDGLPLKNITEEKRPPKILEPIILSPDSALVAILTESYLRGRLGREISCDVVSYWDGNSEITSLVMRSVAFYYAAFESTAESYEVRLINQSTFDITFKSTLPLTCRHCSDEDDASSCCQYKFRMNGTLAMNRCFLFWKDNYTASVTANFVPGAMQTKASFALVFNPFNDDEKTAAGESLWRDYTIPGIKMNILPESTPYKYCRSITDPHLLTFDGVKFDNLQLGDFYLAKARGANPSMEIQVRHETCNGQAACNCGIVVREGNSAFKISVCEAGSWSWTIQRIPTVVRLLSQDPADASAVYVDGTGLTYSVRMPSGLRVEVHARYDAHFSIYVYLPPEYYGKMDSASMCGNSNGNPADDSTDPKRFRIPDQLNYFRNQPPCSSNFNVEATRCSCNDTLKSIVCSNKDPTVEKLSAADDQLSAHWTSGLVCSKQSRMQTTRQPASSLYDNNNADSDFILDNDILFPPYTYDSTFGANVSFTWPTPKGKTEQEVQQYCSDMLESSPAYADCSSTVDLATPVAMCVSDVQIADDWMPEYAYTSFFEQSCLNTLAASITNSSDSANDVLTLVAGKLCPNQCSGNGTCSNGTCTCYPGYIGADCSIDETLPPSLTGAIRGKICDVSKRPCDVISVYGSGVASSSAFKCRFTDQTTGDHVETSGKFITALEYSCPVPETTTHRRRRSATTRTTALSAKTVSITTDGVLYSNALDFVLFDSVCMDCNSTGNCRQKSDSCLISEGCFADKAISPDDSCLQCVPSVSRNSWKDITVVESWNVCTRACDVGVATRNSVCGSKIVKKEVDFCEVQHCPDNAEQETQGFGITLSSEDLKLILLDPVRSLVPFSDALNQYCWKNSAACCNSVGIPTHTSGVSYTSPDLLTYASGYPVVNSTDTSLKIIAKIDLAKFGAECSQTQSQGSNIVYADAKLIYNAVNSEKSKIEQALSIKITSVWPANSLPSSALRSCTSFIILYNLIGFWVFIILVQSNLA